MCKVHGLILLLVLGSQALEPLTISAIIGGALSTGVVYKFWDDKIVCQFNECCSNPYWLPLNVSKFEEDFDAFVYGQHIVKNVVSRALKAHLKKEKPKKALVLSFHGWTGTGKNYVARFVAQSLFREGMKSKFVKVLISTVNFPDPSKVDIYKKDLQKEIKSIVEQCPRAVFIFDEIDKMPEGLVDAVKPFIDFHDSVQIDFHESVQGIDFRQTIFVFLSNTGGKDIIDISLQAWNNGRSRETLEYKEFEKLIKIGAFNEIGGLHQTSVIDKHLVDWYVPFLPLERKHVANCVIAEAFDRNSSIILKPNEIDEVLDQLIYYPPNELVYSTTGCKTISAKVDMILDELLSSL